MTLHRSPSASFPETVTWLADLLHTDRRMATHVAWEVCFRIGTDRHLWVDTAAAHRFITNHTQHLEA